MKLVPPECSLRHMDPHGEQNRILVRIADVEPGDHRLPVLRRVYAEIGRRCWPSSGQPPEFLRERQLLAVREAHPAVRAGAGGQIDLKEASRAKSHINSMPWIEEPRERTGMSVPRAAPAHAAMGIDPADVRTFRSSRAEPEGPRSPGPGGRRNTQIRRGR